MPELLELRPEIIEVGDRHRPLDEAACDRLIASMRDNGLRQPITVRVVDMMVIDGKEVEGVPVLVAGRHRLEAARRLGWSHIDCIEVDDDAIKAEMWEIAENLHRLDLTKEQRDKHIRRYAELIAAQREVAAAIVPQHGEQSTRTVGRPKSVIQEVADATGLGRETVRRAVNPKPIAEVIPLSARSQEDVILMQANAIVAAWNRASPEAREIAMDQMDGGPVFDRSRAAG